MGSNVAKFVAGAGLVAASFLIPGSGFFATTLGSSLLGLSRVAGLGLLNASLVRRPDLGQEAVDARFHSFGPQQPERIVYGETEVALNPAWWGNPISLADPNARDPALFLVVGTISVGSEDGSGIEGVQVTEFDGRPGLTPDPGPYLATGDLGTPSADYGVFDGHVRYGLHLGDATQTSDAELEDRIGDDWTTEHRGRGVAYLAVEMRRNIEAGIFEEGPPTIVAHIRGRKCFDPRDSTWKWTLNPVLHARDYLMSQYGYNLPASQINDTLMTAAANVCDSDPGNGRGAPMFSAGGALQMAETPEEHYENLTRILSSCRGYLTYEEGQYGIRISQADAPSGIKFTDDDLFGEIEVILPGSRRKPNKAVVRYLNPSADYQADEVPVPESFGTGNPYLTEDSDIPSVLPIDLPFTFDRRMAEDIGFVSLKEARLTPIRWVTNERGLLCSIGDIVELSSEDMGWTDKEIRVGAIEIMTDTNRVRLTGLVNDDAAYDLDPNSTVPGVPGTDLPDPTVVEPVTNVVQDCEAGIFLPAQAFQPRLKISWDASPHPWLEFYEVSYREVGTTPWLMRPRVHHTETEAFVDQVEMAVEYESRVVAVNSFGVRSTPVVASSCTIAAPDDQADQIDDLTGTADCSNGVTLQWTMPSPNRVVTQWVYGYTAFIREQGSGGTPQDRWDNGTPLGSVNGFADLPAEWNFNDANQAQYALSMRLKDSFDVFVTDPLEIIVTNPAYPCIDIVGREPLVLNPKFNQGSPGEGSYWALGVGSTGVTGTVDAVTPTVGAEADLVGSAVDDIVVLVQVPDDDDDITKTVSV